MYKVTVHIIGGRKVEKILSSYFLMGILMVWFLECVKKKFSEQNCPQKIGYVQVRNGHIRGGPQRTIRNFQNFSPI